MVQGVLLHSNVFSDFALASHTFSRVGIGPTLCLREVRTLFYDAGNIISDFARKCQDYFVSSPTKIS